MWNEIHIMKSADKDESQNQAWRKYGRKNKILKMLPKVDTILADTRIERLQDVSRVIIVDSIREVLDVEEKRSLQIELKILISMLLLKKYSKQ